MHVCCLKQKKSFWSQESFGFAGDGFFPGAFSSVLLLRAFCVFPLSRRNTFIPLADVQV